VKRRDTLKEAIIGKRRRKEVEDGNVQCKDKENTQRYSMKLSRNEDQKNKR
jgi:hypothetical protein